MGAEMPGDRFRMPQPIPSYLIALAAGDLEFRALGERSGVYAEPSMIDAAAYEFADTEAMIGAVEAMYGPYRWGRYDLLVLPPSFPSVSYTHLDVYKRQPQKFVASIYQAVAGDFVAATQRVYSTAEMPSHLVLPVVAGGPQ